MTTKPTWFWPTIIGVTALTGLGVGLVIRSRMKNKPVLPVQPPAQPWPAVSLEDAMPTANDFPSGWMVADTGHYEKYPDPESSQAAITIQWRVLHLLVPTTMCNPPCEWIAVWAASNSFGAVTQGWALARSSDKAYDIIADKTEEVE